MRKAQKLRGGEPEDVFAPVDHDLRICGLRRRLVFTAPPDGDPQQWHTLVVSGVPLGPLEFEHPGVWR